MEKTNTDNSASLEESCNRAMEKAVVLCWSVFQRADYFIIKSKLWELRELRVWPCLGSWKVFIEEATSELDVKGSVFARR